MRCQSSPSLLDQEQDACPPELLLDSLSAQYEALLPQEMAQVEEHLAQTGEDFAAGCTALLAVLHRIKGQAGIFDYTLLGDIAGCGHDLLRQVRRAPMACLPLAAELREFLGSIEGAMAVVVEHRCLGDGGEAGSRLLAGLYERRESLMARITAAADATGAPA